MDTNKMAADIEAHIAALTTSGKQPSKYHIGNYILDSLVVQE
jgi:hypothetical protein